VPGVHFVSQEIEMSTTSDFYDDLAPLYHLIYPDWQKSIERHATMLEAVIRERWLGAESVLDASCGIGTQALGLAKLGYAITASDLSFEEIARAKREAAARSLKIRFSVTDMRQVHEHHQRQFDLVISCDNSIPHLLSDDDILLAFQQFYRCTRPGGGCIISVRDYEKEDLSRQKIKPYGVREEDGARWLAWQLWDPHPPIYDVTLYFVEDRGDSECRTHVMRSTYYAVGIPKLMDLMKWAGFEEVCRLDNKFFQPLIVGTRAA